MDDADDDDDDDDSWMMLDYDDARGRLISCAPRPAFSPLVVHMKEEY